MNIKIKNQMEDEKIKWYALALDLYYISFPWLNSV